MLAARGDLQRLLSCFLAQPITVIPIYTHASPRVQPASLQTPITQEREVHLMVNSKLACVATSTVTITTPYVESLVLDRKFAIGQTFAELGRKPEFNLLSVSTNIANGMRELRRTYTLETEGYFCNITEVFPDRRMFELGEEWLHIKDATAETESTSAATDEESADEEISEPGTVDRFFKHTPHSIADTPTLNVVLDKQAVNPAVADHAFAAYPAIPADPAASISYTEVTYREFARMVDYQTSVLSARLKDTVLARADGRDASEAPTIALLFESGFHLAVLVMATMKLNATAFLLAPANSEAAVAHLLKSCKVAAVLHAADHADKVSASASLADIPAFVINVAECVKPAPAGHALDASELLHPAHPAIPIIVHSSGSTEFPKPVRWSNESFLSNSQVMLTDGGWSAFANSGNRFLCLGPLFHTLGLTIGLGGAICEGSTIVFPLTRSWPVSTADLIRSLRLASVKTCVIVPLMLEQVTEALENEKTEDPFDCLASLDLLIVGGAHCPEKLARNLVSRGVNLKNIYGSSETGHLMVGDHTRSARDDFDSWNSVRPFPHTSMVFKPVDASDGSVESSHYYQVHLPADDVRMAPGVLKPGEETWNTGDVVQECPPGSGWYKLMYRDDDILVHVSGEKTNPVPMETFCRETRLIQCIAIFGHQQRVTAAIVQLNKAKALELTEEERVEAVHKLIREANQDAPSHSRLLEDMVMILPLDYPKEIPRTNKGNCIRKKALVIFKDEIDALYRNFEDDGSSADSEPESSTSTWVVSDAEIASKLRAVIAKTASALPASFDGAKSLFELGLDSVTAMALRKALSKAFDIKLSSQFIYQNASLDALSTAIYAIVASRSVTPSGSKPVSTAPVVVVPAGPSRGETLASLIQRQIEHVRIAAPAVLASRNTPQEPAQAGEVVAVVGAGGSLGIWQVKALLDRSDVRRVVCMLRAKDVGAAWDKVEAAFEKAELGGLAGQCKAWKETQLASRGPAVKTAQPLVVLPFDLANPYLAQEEYLALATDLTAIIHTAWKMDFNQVVGEFERDCLSGTTQLLLLSSFMKPKQFFFISSIGVIMESKETPAPETLPPWTKDQYIPVSQHGYSESKFVCEYVIEAASKLLNIPCSMARIGQISGDTQSGVWKTAEMNPSIIAGSARIGKFPSAPQCPLDWTPVDYAAMSTVDLTLQQRPLGSASVFHISNPHAATYDDMARCLRSTGIALESVPLQEWWDAILADEGNPCLQMEGYIEESFVKAQTDLVARGEKALMLEISRTLESAPNSLGKCPPLDESLWGKYVSYWREVGFITK
ncbi:acetyl-CoA synthetase-like protein [Coniophora puteana RWD-64-598 SS2]|uniref:Acetyl-CoA synthetase-like protein n=1 Tax=Coniophora puteana (strain RWD-64-598) TaxID=741705 RepID=A0A5M3MLK8_CONPW|nr:acetyl-CoA synthetase-like protein [Coniophora puteana RWD-64-598 SS2]EIW79917.1 acetyl-CoA synthetase-like protein [Coniophora puteana RWD-64-598 SS2]